MYSPDQVLDQIQTCFDNGSLTAFKGFLGQHLGRTSWVLSSDYVWGNPQRPHDTMVFTLFPDASIVELREAFPKDFKNSDSISPSTIGWLRRKDHFHFCFILDQGDSIFHSARQDRREIARDSIRNTLEFTQANAPKWIVEVYRKLSIASRSNRFNVRLYGDILLLTICYSFVVGTLAREKRITKLLWCSDRDEKTTWLDELVYELSLINGMRRAYKWKVRLDAANLPYLVLTQDSSATAMVEPG